MEYEHHVYSHGSILTTVDGLRQMFPQLKDQLHDDITQEELDAIDIPWEDSEYYKIMERSGKMLMRSMRSSNDQR